MAVPRDVSWRTHEWTSCCLLRAARPYSIDPEVEELGLGVADVVHVHVIEAGVDILRHGSCHRGSVRSTEDALGDCLLGVKYVPR